MKNIINWSYERASWQWDLLCFLIVLFIFLTPKAWFDKREKLANQTSRVIVQARDFSSDRAVLEKRVRELSGNSSAEILNWQEKKNSNGEVFYEIDIK